MWGCRVAKMKGNCLQILQPSCDLGGGANHGKPASAHLVGNSQSAQRTWWCHLGVISSHASLLTLQGSFNTQNYPKILAVPVLGTIKQ